MAQRSLVTTDAAGPWQDVALESGRQADSTSCGEYVMMVFTVFMRGFYSTLGQWPGAMLFLMGCYGMFPACVLNSKF